MCSRWKCGSAVSKAVRALKECRKCRSCVMSQRTNGWPAFNAIHMLQLSKEIVAAVVYWLRWLLVIFLKWVRGPGINSCSCLFFSSHQPITRAWHISWHIMILTPLTLLHTNPNPCPNPCPLCNAQAEHDPTWVTYGGALAIPGWSLTATRHFVRAPEQLQRVRIVSQGEKRHTWKMKRMGDD